jgi:hypothetical protein
LLKFNVPINHSSCPLSPSLPLFFIN